MVAASGAQMGLTVVPAAAGMEAVYDTAMGL